MEAIQNDEEAVKVCDAFSSSVTPVMYGMVQGSNAPHFTVKKAKELGFRTITYAARCLLPTYLGVKRSLEYLKREGDYETVETKTTPHELFDICGMQELMEFDRQAQ